MERSGSIGEKKIINLPFADVSDAVAEVEQELHCKKIRRFYGKLLGIWLPFLLPLFYGRLPVEHF